jgi:BlaI family transcriptional regulator, penicillinase repressor
MNSTGGAMASKKLTPAEWEIMETVWKLGGAPSVRQVRDAAYPKGDKAYTTVQTVMNMLEKKGQLRREKIGLVNFYKPIRTRSQAVKSEMSSLVSRIFDGSVPALANFLLDSDKLTLEEVLEIKALIHRKENKLKGGKS